MPDILIRGVEMPKTCFDCPFFVVFYKKRTGICTAFGDGTNREKMSDRMKETGRMSGCPLVELSPHGDLIDRDALFKQMGVTDMDCDKCEIGNHGFCERGGEFRAACEAIENAPVIVPSNKEEKEESE